MSIPFHGERYFHRSSCYVLVCLHHARGVLPTRRNVLDVFCLFHYNRLCCFPLHKNIRPILHCTRPRPAALTVANFSRQQFAVLFRLLRTRSGLVYAALFLAGSTMVTTVYSVEDLKPVNAIPLLLLTTPALGNLALVLPQVRYARHVVPLVSRSKIFQILIFVVIAVLLNRSHTINSMYLVPLRPISLMFFVATGAFEGGG